VFAAKAGAYGAFFERIIDRVAFELSTKPKDEDPQDIFTYGGRKNCSRTTYIPRNSSVKRKYLPALSRAFSLLSSHRSFRGNRKPAGGGPAGVAERKADVEKVAAGYDGLDLRAQMRGVDRGLEDILMRDLVEAIMDWTVSWRRCLN